MAGENKRPSELPDYTVSDLSSIYLYGDNVAQEQGQRIPASELMQPAFFEGQLISIEKGIGSGEYNGVPLLEMNGANVPSSFVDLLDPKFLSYLNQDTGDKKYPISYFAAGGTSTNSSSFWGMFYFPSSNNTIHRLTYNGAIDEDYIDFLPSDGYSFETFTHCARTTTGKYHKFGALYANSNGDLQLGQFEYSGRTDICADITEFNQSQFLNAYSPWIILNNKIGCAWVATNGIRCDTGGAYASPILEGWHEYDVNYTNNADSKDDITLEEEGATIKRFSFGYVYDISSSSASRYVYAGYLWFSSDNANYGYKYMTLLNTDVAYSAFEPYLEGLLSQFEDVINGLDETSEILDVTTSLINQRPIADGFSNWGMLYRIGNTYNIFSHSDNVDIVNLTNYASLLNANLATATVWYGRGDDPSTTNYSNHYCINSSNEFITITYNTESVIYTSENMIDISMALQSSTGSSSGVSALRKEAYLVINSDNSFSLGLGNFSNTGNYYDFTEDFYNDNDINLKPSDITYKTMVFNHPISDYFGYYLVAGYK